MNDLRYALRMLLKSPGFNRPSAKVATIHDHKPRQHRLHSLTQTQAIDCGATLPGFSAQPGASRWRSCLTYGYRTDGLPFARASRRACRSGASVALGINRTPLSGDRIQTRSDFRFLTSGSVTKLGRCC
jgi:hypothetical protein